MTGLSNLLIFVCGIWFLIFSILVLARLDGIIDFSKPKPKGINITEMEFRGFMVEWLEKYNMPVAWIDDKKIGELFETIRKAKESR